MRQQWSRWIFVLGEHNLLHHFDRIVHVPLYKSSSCGGPAYPPLQCHQAHTHQKEMMEVRSVEVTLGQIQSRWSFHTGRSQIPPPPLILYLHGFDYLLRSPCSALLLHYLVRKCILVAEPIVVEQTRHWCKQLIMVHTYTCSFLFTYFDMPQNGVPLWLVINV